LKLEGSAARDSNERAKVLVAAILLSLTPTLARAAVCFRDTDCAADSLCVDQTCTQLEDVEGNLWCDGAAHDPDASRTCLISGDWECREHTCASSSVVCRNEVGRCIAGPDGWYCGCWDGGGDDAGASKIGSCDDLDDAQLQELSELCVTALESVCGTKRPEIAASCVGDYLTSCENVANLIEQGVRICGAAFEEDPSWIDHRIHRCCESRADPANAAGYECIENSEFSTCEEYIDMAVRCTELFPGGVFPGDDEDDDDDDDDIEDDDDDVDDDGDDESDIDEATTEGDPSTDEETAEDNDAGQESGSGENLWCTSSGRSGSHRWMWALLPLVASRRWGRQAFLRNRGLKP
jgi:hypothetical protein